MTAALLALVTALVLASPATAVSMTTATTTTSMAAAEATSIAIDHTRGDVAVTAFTVNQTTSTASVFDASTTTSITAENTWGDDLRITSTLSDGRSMNLEVKAPWTKLFTEGTYSLGRYGTGTASVGVDGYGYGCSTLGGTLTVLEVTRDSLQRITSFAADYDQSCDYSVGRQSGQVRWKSPWGYSGFRSTRGEFAPQPILEGPGKTVTVSLRSSGTEPMSPTALRVVAPHAFSAGAFQLLGNTCVGRTLRNGETCTASVTMTPKAFGTLTAGVEVVTAEGVTTYAPLNGVGTASSRGTFHPVAAKRVLDTRSGTGGRPGPLGPGQSLDLALGGVGGVPASDVAGVVLNVTVTQPTTAGYLSVYPADRSRPGVSSVNFAARQTRANMVTVPVSPDGRVRFTNALGSTHVIADLVGFYTSSSALAPSLGAGSQFQTLPPRRILDSRESMALRPDDVVEIELDWHHTGLNGAVTGALVNITAVAPDAPGYLSAWDGAGSAPTTSTVNFSTRDTVPNLAVVRVSKSAEGKPRIAVANSSTSTTHVLVDLVGIYEEFGGTGLRYRAQTPTRIVDTRSGLGGVAPALGSGKVHTFTAPTTVTTEDTVALVGNLTAVRPTAPTYLTTWAYGAPKPSSSALNAPAGSTVANAVVQSVDTGRRFSVFNQQGLTPTLVDVMGTHEAYPPKSAGATADSQDLSTQSWEVVTVSHRIR